MKVVVPGRGPFGLRVATELALEGHDVSVQYDPRAKLLAEALGIGIPEPGGAGDGKYFTSEDIHEMYLNTDAWYRGLADAGLPAIAGIRSVTYLYREEWDHSELDDYAAQCKARVLDVQELRPEHRALGFTSGANFLAPILNLPALHAWMEEEASRAGVKIIPEPVLDFDAIEADIVVEAIGASRRVLRGDESIRLRRGQSIIFEGPHDLQEVIGEPRDDISVNVVPWSPTVIKVGATKEWDDPETDAREATFEQMYERALALYPGLASMKRTADPVGFRPMRDQLLFRCVERPGQRYWELNGGGGAGWSLCYELGKRAAQVILAA